MNSNALIQIIFLLLYIIPLVLFLLTLQNTLKIISPENRKISAGNVWFMLIPFLGIIWQFVVVQKIAESIKAECKMLNIYVKEKMPTYAFGLSYCLSYILFFIPVTKTIGALVLLITWSIYWIKVYQYKKILVLNKEGMPNSEKENLLIS